jgi:hypothetical protein
MGNNINSGNAFNRGDTNKFLDRLRKDDLGEGFPTTYEDLAGVPRPYRGDEQASWSKNPPFPAEPASWIDLKGGEEGLEPTDLLQTYGPNINVEQVRVVTTYIEYEPFPAEDVEGVLAFMPYAAFRTNERGDSRAGFEQFPLITVNGAINTDEEELTRLYGKSATTVPVFTRKFAPQEMQTEIITRFNILRFAVNWCVDPYTHFNLAFREVQGATPSQDEKSRLKVWYGLSL